MRIKTQTNNTSFSGYYFGYAKTTGAMHKYPQSSVYTCVYADRKMMSIVQKMLKSATQSRKISVFVENEGGTNYLSIVAKRKDIKKNLPLFFRITKGECSPSLSDGHFWKVLNNKQVQYFKYQISKSDVKKMIRDFSSPHLSITLFKIPTQDTTIKAQMLKFVEAVQSKMPKNNNNVKKLKKIFSPAIIK